MFDQCRSLLEQWVIPAPVIGVTLSIPATAPLAADQGDLLIPSWRDAAMNADAVFTRLRAVLDPENAGDIIVHPVAGDAHRPEEAGRWERADAMALGATIAAKSATATATAAADYAKTTANRSVRGVTDGAQGLEGNGEEQRVGQAARGSGLQRVGADTPSGPSGRTPAVLRMFDAPESIEVEEAAGMPDACWWRGRRLGFSAVDGPERLSGDWWRVDAFARDYWRCTVASEGELLLYRDAGVGLTPRWFVQGWYD